MALLVVVVLLLLLVVVVVSKLRLSLMLGFSLRRCFLDKSIVA